MSDVDPLPLVEPLVEPLLWRYVSPQGQVVHGLYGERAQVGLCGSRPGWWRYSSTGWNAADSLADFARLVRLKRCGRCDRIARMRHGYLVRPHTERKAAYEAVFDWLALNRVNELLPQDASFSVRGSRLSYTSFRWAGPRGWDADMVLAPDEGKALITELRTVPLLKPVTEAMRQACLSAGVPLTEIPA